ncbi:MAG TPA: tetratricopeptide repeat protein [Roseiflexaceae bacterium]|nr:tetratricopeptide repeat protein [Roseiflexaceae bacterium]
MATDPSEIIKAAEAKLKERAWDEAVAILRQGAQQHGQDVRLLAELGKVLRLNNQYGEAIEVLRRAQALAPDAYDVLYQLGLALRAEAQIWDAIEAHKRLVELFPDQPMARFVLAKDRIFLGAPERALPDLERLLEADPASPAFRLGYGEALVAMGQHTRAIQVLGELLQQIPRFVDALLALAEAQSALLRFDDWKDSVRRAAELDPNAASVQHWLSKLALAEGRVKDSFHHLGRALEAHPRMFQAHLSLAGLHWSAEQYEQATEHFDAARAIAPWNGVVMGLYAQFEAERSGAVTNLDQLVGDARSMPYSKVPYYLGVIFFNTYRDQGRAIEFFELAARHAPEDVVTLRTLGEVYSQAERYGDAVRVLKRAVELAPGRNAAWQGLAYAYLQLERFQEAREAYETALRYLKPSAALRHGYGMALYSLDLDAEAAEQLEQAHKLDPKNGNILFALAAALDAKGDRERALSTAKKAQAILGQHNEPLQDLINGLQG